MDDFDIQTLLECYQSFLNECKVLHMNKKEREEYIKSKFSDEELEIIKKNIKKKKTIRNPPLEYRMIPKKVKIIGESSLTGDRIITQFEQVEKKPVIMEQTFVRKRNQNKKILFNLINKDDEKLQIAHYKGNDFLSVFVDAGVHPSRFMLTKKQVEQLIEIFRNFKFD